jgi:tRNA-specific 2-thiouridylase
MERHMAVALFSGGGDSQLAAALVRSQGIAVLAVNFSTCFFNLSEERNRKLEELCEKLGLEFKSIFLGDEYLRMLASPKFGYGGAFNPCIDCHILMLRSARRIMNETGAQFVISGEVAGQRPMSQNMQALGIVERESGLRGRLLRPLSAQLLPPTLAELNGIVDRRRLLDIRGRSRRRQNELARELGINDLPVAAGGCALAEKGFGEKVRDLFQHAEGGVPSMDDALLLRYGRHLRCNPEFKIVVGKNKLENESLTMSAKPGDLMFSTPGRELYVGPVVLARGRIKKEHWEWIASVMLRYADVEKGSLQKVLLMDHAGAALELIEARPMDYEQVRQFLI